MNRELPHQFLEARSRIEARLDELGFELSAESFYPSAFGSASSEYRHGRSARRIQLSWDGKEASLWLSASDAGRATPASWEWNPLESMSVDAHAIPSVRHGGDALSERIGQLLLAIEEEFGPPAG
jgi:hypothetical protein